MDQLRRLGIAIGVAAYTLVSSVSPASAGDRPFSWTGFYAGAHTGAAMDYNDFSNPYGATLFGGEVRSPGPFLGGQLGYNYQSGIAVYGLQADVTWANMQGTATCMQPAHTLPAGIGEALERRHADFSAAIRNSLLPLPPVSGDGTKPITVHCRVLSQDAISSQICRWIVSLLTMPSRSSASTRLCWRSSSEGTCEEKRRRARRLPRKRSCASYVATIPRRSSDEATRLTRLASLVRWRCTAWRVVEGRRACGGSLGRS